MLHDYFEKQDNELKTGKPTPKISFKSLEKEDKDEDDQEEESKEEEEDNE